VHHSSTRGHGSRYGYRIHLEACVLHEQPMSWIVTGQAFELI
jgi:hypothetical protein